MAESVGPSVLYIEPFYGGSHKQLMDLLVQELPGDLFTLPASKWHWRMRTSSLHFSQCLPRDHNYRTLFASSVLNLCELVSLRPDLGQLYKVLYFHENQLVYPVRKQQDRDFQYGYNEILSCLVADTILFNSSFNMSSFLSSIDTHLRLIPDHRPRGLADAISDKCVVLYFPLQLELPLAISNYGVKSDLQEHCSALNSCKLSPEIESSDKKEESLSVPSRDSNTVARGPLHIVWPHRWEHDKGPEELSSVIAKLLDAKLEFRLSILGSHTNDIPDCFSRLFPILGPRLVHNGPVPRDKYWQVLGGADVVLSTAQHEFFGVAMLEAVWCGCYPLCPNRLVYPELYPQECLYNTEQQLFKRLRRFCQHPRLARKAAIHTQMSLERFLWTSLKEEFKNYLRISDTCSQSYEQI